MIFDTINSLRKGPQDHPPVWMDASVFGEILSQNQTMIETFVTKQKYFRAARWLGSNLSEMADIAQGASLSINQYDGSLIVNIPGTHGHRVELKGWLGKAEENGRVKAFTEEEFEKEMVNTVKPIYRDGCNESVKTRSSLSDACTTGVAEPRNYGPVSAPPPELMPR